MIRHRRGSLRGWWKYLPFIAVPFAVLFFEVWHNTQILNNEYRKNTLRTAIRQSGARLDGLEDHAHELARMERVLERAPDLGLIPPNPGQVIKIEWTPAPEASGPIGLARHVREEKPDPPEPLEIRRQ